MATSHGIRARTSTAEPGNAPTRAALHEAALAYLARGAASEESLIRVLGRRIDAWVRRARKSGLDEEAITNAAESAREQIPVVTGRLRELSLLNDVAYAEMRAKRMSSAGRSRRAISLHLSQKGVASATVRAALSSDAEAEFAAAITFARKRRLGPFAAAKGPTESREEEFAASRKAFGAMARAGFDFTICERVLRMERADAEARLRSRHEF